MAAQVGIRKWLNDQGFNDNDITYNNGAVSLKGKNFINATPEADNSTYASADALQNAYKQYQANDRTTMLNNQLNSLNTMAQAKPAQPKQNVGLQNAMFNMTKATNDKPFQFTQTQAPFAYNKDNDPAYQAALQSAMQNAKTAQNNAMVGLGSQGIANSSVALDRANQIQQREAGNVTNNVLPQLMQQAYQRYQDQNANDYRTQLANYNASQDQFRNNSALADMLNRLDQQGIENDRLSAQDQFRNQSALAQMLNQLDQRDIENAYRNRTFDRGVLESDRTFNRQHERDQRGDMVQDRAYDRGVLESDRGYDRGVLESDRNYDRGVLESDRQFGLNERQSNASIANMAASNARANEANALARDRFNWEKDSNNPDNLHKLALNDPYSLDNRYKQAQLDKIIQETTKKAGGTDEEKMRAQSEAMVNQLRSGKTTADAALKLIDEDEKLGFYNGDEGNQLRKIIYTLYPEYDPVKIEEKRNREKKPTPFGYRLFGG